MAVDDRIRLLQDRALVDSARRGGAPAFEELYRRHARAAWRLALVVSPQPDAAGAAVVHAFASTLAGPGPQPALASGMRVPLLTAARHAALDAGGRPLRLVPSTASVTDTGPPSAVVEALRALPELWRSALWLADVEGVSLTDAAAVLELAPAAAGPLAERARLGLRQHVVLLGRDGERAQACRRTLDRMAPYAAGTLVARDARRVRDHLDECAHCRDDLAVLDDLPVHLRRAVPLLPVVLGPAAVRRWSASRHRDTGPLGLTLPGGQPVPPWLERAVAGAAAAAIALGVTGAILAGGRNRARGGDGLVRDTTATMPLDSADGEVALGGGGLSDLVLDVVGPTPPAPSAPPGPDATGAAAPSAAALARSAGRPQGAGVPAPTPGAGAGVPIPGPGTTPPPAPDDPGTPPSAPPPSEPAAEVTVGVGDTLAVTIGDQCTGIELLGTAIGCPPPQSDSILTLDTGGSLLPDLGL